MPSKLNVLLEQQLRQDFAEIDNMLLIDYQGLNSEKMAQFRTKLREKKLKMEVVKNSIFKIAVRSAPAGKLEKAAADGKLGKTDPFNGPTGIITGGDSVIDCARFAVEWLKANEKTISFKAAMMGEEVFTPGDIVTLSRLPSRKELLGMAANMLQAPIQKVAATMQAGYIKIVWAFQALAEKLENQAPKA